MMQALGNFFRRPPKSMNDIEEQDDAFMRRIVRTRLENTAMSDWPSVKAELDIIIEALGLEYASDAGD